METEFKTQNSVLDLIGNTPLLDVSFLASSSNISLFAKVEWMNPGGSLKDRPVKRMLTKAIESGKLTKDKIIIDSSSGNAGIAYSMIGNALGYNVEIVIPGNASLERKQRMKAHGTNIIETDPIEGYDEALRHVHKLVDADPDKYFLCDQYANENNWLSHYHGTAEEIIQHRSEEDGSCRPIPAEGRKLARGGGCGALSASANALYFRSRNPTAYLPSTGKFKKITTVSRPGCWINAIPAGGMLLIPEASSGCTCAFPIQCSLAFAPRSKPKP